MASITESENQFHQQAVHVCEWKHVEHMRSFSQLWTYHPDAELKIASNGPVWNHHTLGIARGATGVVDYSEFLGLVMMVMHMLGTEIFGVFLAIKLVEVLSCVGQLLAATLYQREVGELDDALYTWYLFQIDRLQHIVAEEQQQRPTMVDDIVDLFRLEFM